MVKINIQPKPEVPLVRDVSGLNSGFYMASTLAGDRAPKYLFLTLPTSELIWISPEVCKVCDASVLFNCEPVDVTLYVSYKS